MSNIPKLRFPEFSGEWEEKKIIQFCEISAGGDIDKNNSQKEFSSSYPYSVYSNSLENKGLYGYANYYKIDSDVVTVTGRGDVGHAVARHEKFVPIVRLLVCKPKNNENVNFLENAINKTKIFIESTGVPQLTAPQLGNVKLFLPSLPEQQKIADFLSNVDSIITAETKILNTLQKKKKALMQKLFTQQLRFKSDDDTDFPAWEEKCIDEIAECIAGATPDTKKNEYWENGTIPWMSSGEVNKKYVYETDRTITQLGYKKCSTKMIPVNTVVIALAGQGKTRGTVALTKIELCTNQSLCAIINKSEYNSEYLFHYLSSQYQELRKISSGGDASRGGLNLKLVGSYRVPLPCLAEQQKIADCLSSLDSLIQTQQKVVTTWQQRKKALLQQMFV